MMPLNRRDDDETNETEPHAGLQGEEPAPVKTGVALAAIKGKKTLSELAQLLMCIRTRS